MATSVSNNVLTSQPAWLDWNDRPESLKLFVNSSYENLTKHTQSSWGVFNGQNFYGVCGVEELQLLKKTILDAYPQRKEFYVLDIGAGNFQWSQAAADFIEKQTDLPKDIKVHIIGVRGESYWGRRIVETDRCKIYNFGSFKVEEVFAKFKEQGLDLENKLDIAISQWCFRHLNDPVGTFVQTFNLLRPKTGHLLVDGFFFLRNKEGMYDTDPNRLMTRLLLDTKAPFLTQYCGVMRSLNHFILRRPDENPCRIPMSYIGGHYVGDQWQIGSENVTRFKREPEPEDQEAFRLYSESGIATGNKAMYERLKQNGVLERRDLTWKPIYAKDEHLMQPPLHQVVIRDDVEAVEELLEKGHDIHESDSNGCTPLHLAIQNKCFKVFQLLLQRGAKMDLHNGKNRAALHEAAFFDTEGVFIQTLIDAGAPVNPKWFYGRKLPLKSAIEAKNLTAVEILIKNGAEISEDQHQELRDPAFLPLRQKGIIPFVSTEGDLTEVFRWIGEGNCVVLHYHGEEGVVYEYPNKNNPNPKLIMCDINPSATLLGKGKWLGYHEFGGYKSAPYDKEKIDARFKVAEHYQFGYEDGKRIL